ncbi:unnamed protein product [Strongylus vulgaris]|uniref:G-protein coupled receptors family 1 profile domain-containing protein n=1 Tax=Strongylus vulgaris TaxID=40348 RepID=A0A3P7LCD6_STRVU|nr:unnamed protein product [Strongylus vulgaris]
MVELMRMAIGALLNIEIWIMLILNVFVLSCIKKGKLYSGKEKCVYLLSTSNICCDIAQLALHAFYIGPSIIAGKWFFDGEKSLGITIAGVLFIEFWIFASLIQMLFSTNRLIIICFPWSSLFSSRRKTFLYIVITLIIATGLTLRHQVFTPCCRTIPDQRYFGYSILNVDNVENHSYLLGLILDAGVSVYSGISYIAMIVYARIKGVSRNSGAFKREIRCAILFFIMFTTYTVIWMTFYVYPLLNIGITEAYVITPILLVFNSGINAIIYLTLNRDVSVSDYFKMRNIVDKLNLLHREGSAL